MSQKKRKRWKPERVPDSERGNITKPCNTCKKELTLLEFHKGNALHGYKPECKSCQVKRGREYKRRPEIKERENAYSRKRWAAKPEEERRAIYESRKEYVIKYKRWWHKHTEAGRKWSEYRDLRKKLRRTQIDLSSVLALEEYNKVTFKSEKFSCEYCEKEIKGSYHLEHIIPVAKDGSGELENLAISCPTCNLRKGIKDLDVFAPDKVSYFKNRKV